jgi:pimeloyl-ACP methyl ester carboxylesterase
LRRPSLRTTAFAAFALGGAAALAAAQRAHTHRIERDPETARLSDPPRGRPIRITSSDGTDLHAELFGSEHGQTIVFIHGWTEDLTYWTYVLERLSGDGYRMLAYDLRGHGQSEAPPSRDYSLDRFGDDLEAVLRAVLGDGERAVVVGHSLGAMSIAAWAERHDAQARASAAALLNTGLGDLIRENIVFPLPQVARRLKEPIARRALLGRRTPLPRVSTPLSHAGIRLFAFGPTASPAQVTFYERMMVRADIEARAASGLAMADMSLHHALARLTVPTLVMAGADDRLTPPLHARRIAELLPNLSAMIELPDTGHMGPLERPAEVADALRELIAAAPANATAAA